MRHPHTHQRETDEHNGHARARAFIALALERKRDADERAIIGSSGRGRTFFPSPEKAAIVCAGVVVVATPLGIYRRQRLMTSAS